MTDYDEVQCEHCGVSKYKLTPDEIYFTGGHPAIDRFWKIQNLPKSAAVGGGDIYLFTEDELKELGMSDER